MKLLRELFRFIFSETYMLNLYIDIETVPNYNISPELKECFERRKKDEEKFDDKASFMAEYGKIVCISV
jgi:hypothetical protein